MHCNCSCSYSCSCSCHLHCLRHHLPKQHCDVSAMARRSDCRRLLIVIDCRCCCCCCCFCCCLLAIACSCTCCCNLLATACHDYRYVACCQSLPTHNHVLNHATLEHLTTSNRYELDKWNSQTSNTSALSISRCHANIAMRCHDL